MKCEEYGNEMLYTIIKRKYPETDAYTNKIQGKLIRKDEQA